MSTRTYSPKNINITLASALGGFHLKGFANGSFVTVERDEEAFEKKTGADGEVTRAQSNNKSGNVKIVLDQASPSNDDLSNLAELDELTATGIATFLMTDSGGNTLVAAGSCWVRKKPASTFSKKAEDRDWILDLAQMEYKVGGSTLVNG